MHALFLCLMHARTHAFIWMHLSGCMCASFSALSRIVDVGLDLTVQNSSWNSFVLIFAVFAKFDSHPLGYAAADREQQEACMQ